MLIGVSGGSGVGKSTLSRRLAEILPNSILINGDIFMHARSKLLEKQILEKIGTEKNNEVFSYNYYLSSFENTKIWVETIEEDVIKDIENEIKKHGNGKDYIIVDWVFLPLCKLFKYCDETICVVSNYELRLERLTKRLQDKSIYNEGDRSYWSYKPRNN
jgi:dephospho-CoA kinase